MPRYTKVEQAYMAELTAKGFPKASVLAIIRDDYAAARVLDEIVREDPLAAIAPHSTPVAQEPPLSVYSVDEERLWGMTVKAGDAHDGILVPLNVLVQVYVYADTQASPDDTDYSPDDLEAWDRGDWGYVRVAATAARMRDGVSFEFTDAAVSGVEAGPHFPGSVEGQVWPEVLELIRTVVREIVEAPIPAPATLF